MDERDQKTQKLGLGEGQNIGDCLDHCTTDVWTTEATSKSNPKAGLLLLQLLFPSIIESLGGCGGCVSFTEVP
jgi:hypothetical protein